MENKLILKAKRVGFRVKAQNDTVLRTMKLGQNDVILSCLYNLKKIQNISFYLLKKKPSFSSFSLERPHRSAMGPSNLRREPPVIGDGDHRL